MIPEIPTEKPYALSIDMGDADVSGVGIVYRKNNVSNFRQPGLLVWHASLENNGSL